MTLKLIKQYSWQLPPAEQIQQIAEALHVTAEIVTDRDLYGAWDAEQAAEDSELGEAVFETRREVGV